MNQVRYFLAVCEMRSFTRAAKHCHVSQPALTTSVKKLEEEFGAPLFHRDRGAISLTALGHQLYPRFQRLALESAGIAVAAENHRRLKQVPLRIGVLATIGPGALTGYLAPFRQRAPGVELELHVGAHLDLIRQLEKFEIDVLLSNAQGTMPEWAVVVPLYDESYVVLLPPGHPLAERTSVRPGDLSGEPYIDRLACEMRERVSAVCGSRRVELYATHRTEREEWVQSLVQAGLGFAFLPERSVVPGETVARPLIEPKLTRTISLLRNADRPASPAAKMFWNQLNRR